MQIEFSIDEFHKFLAKWWVLLFISFGLCGVVLLPLLSGGAVFRADSTDLIIPQLTFFKNAFEKGESPFWNPYLAVGFPNFVSTLSPFAPASLLVRFLSPIAVHSWYLLFTLSLALFFFICFLRELEIGIWGSIIGGISYLIGDFYWTQNINTVSAVLIQALIFLIFIKTVKSKGVWMFAGYVFAGVLTVAYGWIATIVYFANLHYFILLLAFSIFLGFKNGKRVFYKALLALFLIFLVGSIIGLIQLIPAYVMAQFSGRSGGLEYNQVQGYALGFAELFNFVHFTPNRGLEAYLYMGIIPLAFFFLSFFSKNPFAKFFRWTFLVAFLISIKNSPLFWLIIKLPLFNYFQGAARFMLVGSFAGAILVGFGVEYFFVLHKQSKDVLKDGKIISFAVAAAFLMLGTVAIFNTPKVIVSVIASAALLLLGFLAIRFVLRKLKSFTMLLVILTGITIIDFVYVHYSFSLPFSFSRSIYERMPATFSLFEKNPRRILPLFIDGFDDDFYYAMTEQPPPPDPTREFLYLKETYFPNLQLLAGVENLEANEPLLNVDMGRLMALVGTRQLVISGGEEKLDKIDSSLEKRLELFQKRLPLVNFLGIKYLLSSYILDEAPLDFDLIQIEEVELNFMKTPSGEFPLLLVYENPYAKPLAYFSSITDFKDNNEMIYQSFKTSDFKGIFVECSEECNKKKDFTAKGSVSIKNRENGKLELQTFSSDEQFLVFSQNNLPGWQAFIDNQRTQIYKVNTVFMGVFVPAGNHNVSFNYSYWDLFDVGYILKKI